MPFSKGVVCKLNHKKPTNILKELYQLVLKENRHSQNEKMPLDPVNTLDQKQTEKTTQSQGPLFFKEKLE